MGRKRHTPEQIITALREAEVGLARGKSVKLISREYGGMKVSQARRLKELAVTATFFGWLAVRVCAEGSDRVRAHVSR